MSSEVCSIYLLRDNMLELFATHGLRKEAVHVTRSRMGEGLVGTIAAEGPHPQPRRGRRAIPPSPTGPKPARSASTASPACRSSASKAPIGVLAVQHAEPRALRGGRDRGAADRRDGAVGDDRRRRLVDGARRGRLRSAGPLRLSGLKLVAGMAQGRRPSSTSRAWSSSIPSPRTPRPSATRVYSAFRKMREQIDNMAREAEFGTAGEHQEILETYKMFAYDEGWSRRINEAIDSGLTAEAAIERVQQRTRARMREIDDPLLQERMHDLEDLSNRLLRIVSGRMGTAAQTGLAHDAVLIARNLGPAELLEYDRRRLKGVMLEEGSLTAHMTIVARAMGVPVIGRLARHPPQRRGRRDRSWSTATTAASSSGPTARAVERLRASHGAEPEAPRRIRRGHATCRR